MEKGCGEKRGRRKSCLSSSTIQGDVTTQPCYCIYRMETAALRPPGQPKAVRAGQEPRGLLHVVARPDPWPQTFQAGGEGAHGGLRQYL